MVTMAPRVRARASRQGHPPRMVHRLLRSPTMRSRPGSVKWARRGPTPPSGSVASGASRASSQYTRSIERPLRRASGSVTGSSRFRPRARPPSASSSRAFGAERDVEREVEAASRSERVVARRRALAAPAPAQLHDAVAKLPGPETRGLHVAPSVASAPPAPGRRSTRARAGRTRAAARGAGSCPAASRSRGSRAGPSGLRSRPSRSTRPCPSPRAAPPRRRCGVARGRARRGQHAGGAQDREADQLSGSA